MVNMEYYLPLAPIQRQVFAPKRGYLAKINVREFGVAVIDLGGGRLRPSDKIDHSVGLDNIAGLGTKLGPRNPVATIYAVNKSDADRAEKRILSAITISDEVATAAPAIRARLTKEDL